MSTATFAVKAYASRNEMFHSRNMALKVKGDWEGLAMQADEDVAALPAILPEASDEELEKWRKMIHIYKDQHVAYDEDAGQWAAKHEVKQGASEAAPGPSEGAPGSSSGQPV
ncbi:hypothetical protein LTS17_002229 [Exophiala oligosperma]